MLSHFFGVASARLGVVDADDCFILRLTRLYPTG
jgi:hypothetical protein